MKFSEIPGQEHIKSCLRDYADSGKVPHALLIAGPPGAGKMLLARAFVQYLQCESPSGGEPCGHCRSCRLHQELSHPDLHFIFPVISAKADVSADLMHQFLDMLRKYPAMPEEKWLELIEAGNSQPAIYVKEADDIIRADAFPPLMSKQKVFLIWLPEKFRPETANKLLKVIEEPSPGTLFILVSNNELQLLPTIFSRVQRLHAGAIGEAEMARYIRDSYGADAQTATALAHVAEGSLIRADEIASRSGENEEFRLLYQSLMRAAYGIKVATLRDLADKTAAFGREKIRRFLSYVSSQLRENFIFNLRMPSLCALTPEEEAFSRNFSPFVNHLNVEDFLSETDRARTDIERNCNSKIVLFDYFLLMIGLLRRK